MTQKEQGRRPRLGRGDRIAIGILIALVVITMALSGLSALNLRLMTGELYVFLPLMTLLILLGWGMSAVWRRIKKDVVRKAVGIVMVMVMALLLMLALSFASVLSGMNLPSRYVELTNEGHRVVVMRALDPDEGRINARREARLAADPEGSQEMTTEDWGFTYTAYAPTGLGLFYRTDTLLDGEVHIGYASKAELMVEWSDDIAHFFIKNPEIGDDGEMHARG